MQERRQRYERAEKRKKQCKFEIETVAKDKSTTSGNFLKRLADKGISLYFDPYEQCLYAEIHDADDGKRRTYSLEHELGVDMSLLERLKVNGNINTPVKERVDKVDTKKYQSLKAKVLKEKEKEPMVTRDGEAKAKVTKGKSTSISQSAYHRQDPPSLPSLGAGSKGLGRLLGGSGSHGGQTQQGNVNPDGSGNSNSDDLDEQWRRRNGYSY